jgi:hypothetical protein
MKSQPVLDLAGAGIPRSSSLFARLSAAEEVLKKNATIAGFTARPASPMIAANAALAGIKNACRGARPFAATGMTGKKGRTRNVCQAKES